MEVFCEGFGESISERLDQHDIVVVLISLELIAKLLLIKASRDGECTDKVLLARRLGGNKVCH